MEEMYRFSAFIQKEGKWYVSWCPELDIASQGETIEEAIENLKEAIELYLEDEDSEIYESSNTDLKKFLNEIISEISFQLVKFEKNDSAEINIGIVKDTEIPNWETFVIRIKILPMDLADYKTFFELESYIRSAIIHRISISEIQDETIFEKYDSPLVILEEFE